MTVYADGRYASKPWNTPPKWSYSSPNESNWERRVSEALAANTEPAADLSDIVRPPLPQIQLFRPRFGYRTRVLGIADVINIDDAYEPDLDVTGQGSARNSWSNGSW